ncbi:hypothetical protein SAMN04487909_104206 [Aneurinibacillus migulanus]|uniref:Uncharacterized protein n=1 Tax=Aneurinibacillus migulanus TaxID=47500 RepID=A0A1G8L010_ANEMI|nr:hypothetical protein AMI01nite_36940 [Aneurinibacillus migulanus]SDI48979.1 hypothetical protein SAMN04487909_104206 [Aneurinibacillus migulanus]
MGEYAPFRWIMTVYETFVLPLFVLLTEAWQTKGSGATDVFSFEYIVKLMFWRRGNEYSYRGETHRA